MDTTHKLIPNKTTSVQNKWHFYINDVRTGLLCYHIFSVIFDQFTIILVIPVTYLLYDESYITFLANKYTAHLISFVFYT